MTRNQKYEDKKRESGLIKITIWVPHDVGSDFKQMAACCSEDKDLYPVACRSAKTGRLKFV